MLAFFQLPTGQDSQFLVETFATLSGAWANALLPMALKLFWSLAFIDFCWWAFECWKEDFDGLLRGLVQRVVMICFWWSFLTHNQEWLHAITDSFATAGKRAAAAGGMTADISPMGLFHQGLLIFHNIQQSMAGTSLLTNGSVVLVGTMSAVGIMLAFVILLLQFLIAKIEIDVVLGAGVLLLAFNGSRWTRPYGERIIGCAITAGVRIMFIYLLFGASQPLANRWITATQNIPTSQLFETTISIFASVLCYVALAWFVPSLADRLLSGSGGLSASSAIGMAGAAMAAGTAVASMAAKAASTAGTAATGLATGGAGLASGIGGGMSSALSGAGSALGEAPAAVAAPSLASNTGASFMGNMSGGVGPALKAPAPPSIGLSGSGVASATGKGVGHVSPPTSAPSGVGHVSPPAPAPSIDPKASTQPTIQNAPAAVAAPAEQQGGSNSTTPISASQGTAANTLIEAKPSVSDQAHTSAPTMAGTATAAPKTPTAPTDEQVTNSLSAPDQKSQQNTKAHLDQLAAALRSMPETGGHVPAPKLKVDGD